MTHACSSIPRKDSVPAVQRAMWTSPQEQTTCPTRDTSGATNTEYSTGWCPSRGSRRMVNEAKIKGLSALAQ